MQVQVAFGIAGSASVLPVPGLSASAAPQDWCDPNSSEDELVLDIEYMESYGRVEQRRQHLARDASHDDGRAVA